MNLSKLRTSRLKLKGVLFAAAFAWSTATLHSCNFNLNTTVKQMTTELQSPTPGWRAPAYPAKSMDAAGLPNFIVASDVLVDSSNYSQVQTALLGIKNRTPNVPIILLGGFTKSGTTEEINLIQSLRNQFNIAGFSMGSGDPIQGASPNDGARRLCSALTKANYEQIVSNEPLHFCNVGNTLGFYDQRVGAAADYDVSPHASLWLMDARPRTVGGLAGWKYKTGSGRVDNSTQLFGVCGTQYRAFYSDLNNRFGFTSTSTINVGGVVNYQRMPSEIGTHRLVPVGLAADPFTDGLMNAEDAAALKLVLGNTVGIPFVITRTPAGFDASKSDFRVAASASGYLEPQRVNIGKRSIWNVQVGMLNPAAARATVPPAYTEFYVAYDRALIKTRSASDGAVLFSQEISYPSDREGKWRSDPSLAGNQSECCQLDLALRSLDGSNTQRVVDYTALLGNSFSEQCGEIR